jgi:hypothetical protein
MKLNWEGWLYGLGSGFIGGGAGAVGAAIAEVYVSRGQVVDLHHLLALAGTAFIVTGIISAAAYLAKSPLPPIEPTITTVSTTSGPSDTSHTTTTTVQSGGTAPVQDPPK